MNKRHLILFFFFCYSFVVLSQIVDDSTKLVYGPTTSVYTYEKYVQEIDSIFFPIDTTIYNLEKFEFVQKSKIVYQNLGANGTALNPVYYQLPQTIGKIAGYEAFTPYFKSPENFKYYNSRSPFIDLNIGFGGNNRTLVDFSFSRNVNPQWNVGFDIVRLNTDKQIGAQTKIGDNNVQSTSIDFYTYYDSKNKKYTLLFHVLRFTHKVQETGGIKVNNLTDKRLFYQYLNSDIQLRSAGVEDVRTRFHLFQQYSLKPFFQLYYIFDKIKQENVFIDLNLSSTDNYYKNFFISPDSTIEIFTFDEIKNQVGIKGKFSSKLFYNTYLKRRDLNFKNNNLGNFGHVSENYIGGKIKYIHDKNNNIEGAFEILSGGEYLLSGQLNNKYFKAKYTSSVYKPSYFAERYSGNHYDWKNNFNSTFTNIIEGSSKFDLKIISLEPKVSFSTVNDFIYFDTTKVPLQAGLVVINNYSLAANLVIKKNYHFDNLITFNNVTGNGADAFRIPEWSANGKWYYEGVAFDNYVQFQIGANLHWQSGFFAKAYDPITQQFHNQNNFKIDSYFVADIFLVFKVKRVSIFAKVVHVNQPREDGYMATPFYSGQQRVFDFGVHWLFFD